MLSVKDRKVGTQTSGNVRSDEISHLTLRRSFSKPLSNCKSSMIPQFVHILIRKISASVCLWSLAWSPPPLDILFQSIRAKFLTKMTQNQRDIVAEAHFNAPGHARSTGHLLESSLRRFENVTGNCPAQGYSTQSVSVFINELWLRRWSSPDNFAVLRMFRNTKPDCHSKSPLILGNPYLANRKGSLVSGNTSLFSEWRLS